MHFSLLWTENAFRTVTIIAVVLCGGIKYMLPRNERMAFALGTKDIYINNGYTFAGRITKEI